MGLFKDHRVLLASSAGVALFATAAVLGCVRSGQDPWVVKSAPTPEGWADPTPVGEVHIRQYPAYRAAIAESAKGGEATMSRRDPSGSLFMVLFRHIDSRDIPMTAPVEMVYEAEQGGTPRMTSMAFLYQSTSVGETGEAGSVKVVDVPPQTFASLGVRGDYTQRRFEENLDRLLQWVDAQSDQWEIAGPPRYLGYNGPFTPSAMKYGEVQVPVRARPLPPSDTRP